MTVERERLTHAAIAHDDERCGVAERQLRVDIAQELAPGGAPLLGVEPHDLDATAGEDGGAGAFRQCPAAAPTEIGDGLGYDELRREEPAARFGDLSPRVRRFPVGGVARVEGGNESGAERLLVFLIGVTAPVEIYAVS